MEIKIINLFLEKYILFGEYLQGSPLKSTHEESSIKINMTILIFYHHLHESSKFYWVNFHERNYDTHNFICIQSAVSVLYYTEVTLLLIKNYILHILTITYITQG